MRAVNITITLESPLHMGSERGQETGLRSPFLKTVDGLPFIPASSVKGCLRHEAERLLRSQKIAICSPPTAEYMCQSDQPCPVCRLFGSPWYASTLYFNDLHLVNADIFTQGKTAKIPLPTARSGVRLNRKRRIAEDRSLFEKELFEPGYPWQFVSEIIYEGEDDDSLVLLYMAARAVSMLGSGRSRGLGWSEVALTETNQTIALDEMWHRWSAALPKLNGKSGIGTDEVKE